MKLLFRLGKWVFRRGFIPGPNCDTECCGGGGGPTQCPDGEVCYYKSEPCPGTDENHSATFYVRQDCFEARGLPCLGYQTSCATVKRGTLIPQSSLPEGAVIIDCDTLDPDFRCCTCLPHCEEVADKSVGDCCCSDHARVEVDWSVNYFQTFGDPFPNGQRQYVKYTGSGSLTVTTFPPNTPAYTGPPVVLTQERIDLVNGVPTVVTQQVEAVLDGMPLAPCATANVSNGHGFIPFQTIPISVFVPDCDIDHSMDPFSPQPPVDTSQEGFSGSCTFDAGSCYDRTLIDVWSVNRSDLTITCTVTYQIRVVELGTCGGGCGSATQTIAAVPEAKWPSWIKKIAEHRQDGDVGVGSTIARTIGPVGGDAYKAAYKAATGKECGCVRRQAVLDARYPYA